MEITITKTNDGYRWTKKVSGGVIRLYREWHEFGRDGGKRMEVCARLWWNGARWIVWVNNLYVCEDTDYKDYSNPPLQWAEDWYRLANGL